MASQRFTATFYDDGHLLRRQDTTVGVRADTSQMPLGFSPLGVLGVASNLPGVFIEVTPLDEQLDGDGFTDFERTYRLTSVVTLTAPVQHEGWIFVSWRINGLLHGASRVPSGPTMHLTMHLTILGNAHVIEAVYVLPGFGGGSS